jgi:XRE family transcriptional regulator, regulator of sulfur utilization
VGVSELNVQIGQLLKDLRDERGWSLREFGLIVGMNKTYLGDIELGKRNPTINSLEKIVAGYGLTVREFFAKMPD